MVDWCYSYVLLSRDKWKGHVVPQPSKIQWNTNKISLQRTYCKSHIPKTNHWKIFVSYRCKFWISQLRLNKQSSYLTTSSSQCGRYRYQWLPFGRDWAGKIFREIDEIFKEVLNMFSIAGDILVQRYSSNGTDYDRMLCILLQILRENIEGESKIKPR